MATSKNEKPQVEPGHGTGTLAASEEDLNPCALAESRGKRTSRLRSLVADGAGFPGVLVVVGQVAHACAVEVRHG